MHDTYAKFVERYPPGEGDDPAVYRALFEAATRGICEPTDDFKARQRVFRSLVFRQGPVGLER